MSVWLTALMMGLVGSLHCAGMCSPLAMALTKNKPFLFSSILYNSGRVLIYALLGAVASKFGSFFHLAPYQQIASVLLGVIFLLAGLGVGSMRLPYFGASVNWFTAFLKRMFSSVLNQKSGATTLLLGMINGLLPCGLTYMALSACLVLPQAMDGFLFMIYFGLGTWPVMIGFAKLLTMAKWKSNFSMARFSKLAMVFIGCVLLLRVWWQPHQDSTLQIRSLNQITICK